MVSLSIRKAIEQQSKEKATRAAGFLRELSTDNLLEAAGAVTAASLKFVAILRPQNDDNSLIQHSA